MTAAVLIWHVEAWHGNFDYRWRMGGTMSRRGVERRVVFEDARDHEHFLELLPELVARYGVKIHAYVLMGNHYPMGKMFRRNHKASQFLTVSPTLVLLRSPTAPTWTKSISVAMRQASACPFSTRTTMRQLIIYPVPRTGVPGVLHREFRQHFGLPKQSKVLPSALRRTSSVLTLTGPAG